MNLFKPACLLRSGKSGNTFLEEVSVQLYLGKDYTEVEFPNEKLINESALMEVCSFQ